VSLSLVVENGSDPLSDAGRWLLCGAVAAYFALGVLTGAISRSADRLRTISRIITGIAAPLLLGLLATGLSGRTLVICLAAVVLAHLWFERRLTPAPAAEAPDHPATPPRPPAPAAEAPDHPASPPRPPTPAAAAPDPPASPPRPPATGSGPA
jgi:hypothetical protein